MRWDDLPHWQQHGSELVHTGYRQACGSVRGCLHSWTYIHNETVNIYSHIVGAVVFLGLPFYIFSTSIPPRWQIASTVDIIVCTTYLMGVTVCFIFSSLFHTFMSHSPTLYASGMKMDFQGILILMWSSTIPLVYYGFPCLPHVQALYLVSTTILALGCSALTLIDAQDCKHWKVWWYLPRRVFTFRVDFSGPHLGHYRAALFGTFGAVSFIVPIVHGIWLYGLGEYGNRVGLRRIGLTAVFNTVGVVIYTLKFPERWYPQRFDLLGASHQLMHIMVLCAALSYAMAVISAFDYSHENKAVCVGWGVLGGYERRFAVAKE
ncbi:hemolysin-III related-domain-containing protein [Diplogelasinospora grovesii]|uniref:Hemolysin-III related-domain-containing protein n=1 Tax=Diplogelasinospora grovesii TaxID=303347 RepID=A0AAN6NIH9_9PEZI|nr:hemolysin-III related-domain-containing protein [Diplogelasinospora grovesii]